MTELGSCLAQGARAEASDSAGLPRADSCGSRSSLAVSSACSPRGWPGRCRRPAGAPRVPRCGRVGARRRGAPVRGGRLVERRAARDRGPDPLGRSYFGRVERAHRVRPSGPTTRSTGSMGCAVPIIQDRRPTASCTAGHPIAHRRGGGSGRVPRTLHRKTISAGQAGSTMKTTATRSRTSAASIRRRSSPVATSSSAKRQPPISDHADNCPRQIRCLAIDHDGRTGRRPAAGPGISLITVATRSAIRSAIGTHFGSAFAVGGVSGHLGVAGPLAVAAGGLSSACWKWRRGDPR